MRIPSGLDPGKLSASGGLALVGVVFALLVGLNAWFGSGVLERLSRDPEVVNCSGRIRGSIQRIAKLEGQGIESPALIERVDGWIGDLRQYADRNNASDLPRDIAPLLAQWEAFKREIERYRANPTPEETQRLLAVSETCWNLADEATMHVQSATEARIAYLRLLFAMTISHVAFAVVAVWAIRRYIRTRLEFLTHHDILTGLHNRSFFEELLPIEISRSERSGVPFSLIVFDIDQFKRVNDAHGHRAGDQVLAQLGAIVRNAVQPADYVCRIGGEEFAIVATDIGLVDALRLARKVCAMVGTHAFGAVTQVTISLGVAQHRRGDEPETLLSRANEALQRAKLEGCSRVCTTTNAADAPSDDYPLFGPKR